MSKSKSSAARKKKQVSKHILNSRDDDETTTTTTTPTGNDSASDATSNKKKRKSKKSKPNKNHPTEAFTYLTQWKANKSNKNASSKVSIWKFNKNTQSWLIRNMYEVDKVAKPSFLLLLEYLKGLEGETTKERIKAEASRRARRYKEYSKTSENKDEEDGEEGNNDDDDENNNNDNNNNTSSTTTTKTTSSDDNEEEVRWGKIDDNEKRKEYKRARKILDLMKESEN